MIGIIQSRFKMNRIVSDYLHDILDWIKRVDHMCTTQEVGAIWISSKTLQIF